MRRALRQGRLRKLGAPACARGRAASYPKLSAEPAALSAGRNSRGSPRRAPWSSLPVRRIDIFVVAMEPVAGRPEDDRVDAGAGVMGGVGDGGAPHRRRLPTAACASPEKSRAGGRGACSSAGNAGRRAPIALHGRGMMAQQGVVCAKWCRRCSGSMACSSASASTMMRSIARTRSSS